MNLDLVNLFNPRTMLITAKDLPLNGFRLDSGNYLQADTGLSGLQTCSLCDIANVTQVVVFGKRQMQGVFGSGLPLFSGSEIAMIDPEPSCFLRNEFRDRLRSRMFVEPDTILMTLSGTVGTVALTSSRLLNAAVTDDVMRIKCLNPLDTGFLYTFLRSGPCQARLASLAYGAVIQHLKAFQIEQLSIPVLSNGTRRMIDVKVRQAHDDREVAYQLLAKAGQMLLEVTGLSSIEESFSFAQHEFIAKYAHWIGSKEVTGGLISDNEYRLDAHFYNPTAQLAVANIKKCRCEMKTVGEVAERVLMGPRFKRNYVESTHGVPFLSGKNIVQIRPTDLKYLSNLQIADMQELIVKRGWTLITCSGTIGRTCFVWKNYEDYAASQHILRVLPDESKIDAGYLYAFLASPYGYEQTLRYRHGSVIDEITDKQIEHVLVPCPSRKDQETIGDMVREAYEKRAEAIRLEDEAQAILMNELSKAQGGKGV